MSMSDPIADLLTRIRNALRVGHPSVDVPLSTQKVEVCRVLKEQGYITDYTVEEEPLPGLIRVDLKYTRTKEPIVRGLRRISKPSLRVYVGSKDIQPVCSGLGISVISTPKGVMTGKQARNAKVGGEIICEVW